MLDEILSISIKEIAFNCSLGCTPSELWGYIDGIEIPSTGRILKLNDFTKKYIHRLLLNQTNISLLPNPNYKGSSDINQHQETPSQTQLQLPPPLPSNPLQLVKKENEENNDDIISTQPPTQPLQDKPTPTTPTTSQTTTQITTLSKIVKKKVKQTVLQWNQSNNSINTLSLNKNFWLEPSDAFMYVADKYNQMVAIGIVDRSMISDLQWKILEQVSKSREQGCLTRDLSNLFNIDPRNIFTPIKDLELKGIITKDDYMSTHLKNCVSTTKIRLKKYQSKISFNPIKQDWVPKYWYKIAFIYTLDKQESKSLPIGTLMNSIGISKSTLKKLKTLYEKYGYISAQQVGKQKMLKLEKPYGDKEFWDFIEKDYEVPSKDSDSEGEDDQIKTPKKQTEDETTTGSAVNNEEEEEDNDSMGSGVSNLIMELPINLQVFNVIRESGKNGTTIQEIREKMGGISTRYISSILKALIVSFGVTCIPITVGRQFKYRIYAEPKDFLDKGLVEDKNEYIPDKYKQLFSYRQQHINDGIEQVNDDDDDKNEEKEDNENKEQQEEFVSKKRHLFSMTHIKRLKMVYQFIQSEKGAISSDIITYMHRMKDTSFEKRTNNRILEVLLEEKKINATNIYTQYLNGTHRSLLFIYDAKYSIDDIEIQDIIESIKSLAVTPCFEDQLESSQSTTPKRRKRKGRKMKKNNDYDDDSDIEDDDYQYDEDEEMDGNTDDEDDEDEYDDDEDYENIREIKPIKPSKKSLSTSVAISYGFIRGKIVRAKILHTFLWNHVNRNIIKTQLLLQSQSQIQSQSPSQSQQNASIYNNKQIEEEMAEKTKVLINLFIKQLKISDYLKIVSQPTEIKDLANHIKQGTIINDLPTHIRNQLFQNKKFLQRLGELFRILYQLGLVTIEVSVNTLTNYGFVRHVKLTNHQGDTKQYDLASLDTLHRYWSDLQFISLLPKDIYDTNVELDDFILNRVKMLRNISLWGVPRVPLSRDIKIKLLQIFQKREQDLQRIKEEQEKEKQQQKELQGDDDGNQEKEEKEVNNNNEIEIDINQREFLRVLAGQFHVQFKKLIKFYGDYLTKKENSLNLLKRRLKMKDELDQSSDDDDQFGNEGVNGSLFKEKRMVVRVGNRLSSTVIEQNIMAKIKREEFKNQIKPYRRFKWSPVEDSQLLKKYTEVFRDWFLNKPENAKNGANHEFYVTPSGIPSMLNPLWEDLGRECQKLGQLCYRRMRLLVKKYPSYKNFFKTKTTPDLPSTVKEFNTLFLIQYNKSENIETFEFSRFNKTDEALMRDKIIYLVSLPDNEYNFKYGEAVLGNNKLLSRQVLENLTNDRILKRLKTKNASRPIAFCVQKIYFKNNTLNKEFFQENRLFMSNIKEIPIEKLDDDQLFQYDPLTSGGSVSSMLQLLSVKKVSPIVNAKAPSDKEKTPKSRDFSGGRRLDFMLNKITVSYLIREYIDYSYIENERKRAINPEIILLDDPLESEKKKFNKIFDGDWDDQQQQSEKKEGKEIMEEEQEDKAGKEKLKNKKLKTSHSKENKKDSQIKLYQDIVDQFDNKFIYKEFKQLLFEKLIKFNSIDINEKSNNYLVYFYLMCQEVFRLIHSSKTKGIKRKLIINHFVNSNNSDSITLAQKLLKEDITPIDDIDLAQYLYNKLPSIILELKSIGLIDTLFTFSEKKYISKEYFADTLVPLEYTLQMEHQQRLKHEQRNGVLDGQEPLSEVYQSPITWKEKKLIKPWIDTNGHINRANFNKMFYEFITNIYHYPGSTLETIAHRLQKYSPSLLKEVAIILQQLDYIQILEYDYKPPTLFTQSEFVTKPFNQHHDGCTQLIFNTTPKFFNLQPDFSIYLLTEDF